MKTSLKQTIIKGIDPHLGYNYLSGKDFPLETNEEFKQGYIKLNASSKSTGGIAILGGSTSDLSYDGSWVRPFRDMVHEINPDIPIYSAAVSGYSSNQEVFKLIRDLLPLQPDIVISLNGVNDLGHIQAVSPEHPMVHSFQKKLSGYLLPSESIEKINTNSDFFQVFTETKPKKLAAFNDRFTIGGENFGTTSNKNPAENWLKNLLIMHAISKEFGFSFHSFLQPIVGAGEYMLSIEEQRFYEKCCSEWGGYEKSLKCFYEEARKISSENSHFITDLVDIFKNEKKVYSDIRHPNKVGNKIIAKAILSRVKGILTPE